MNTRTLEPWETVAADDVYNGQPVGADLADVQAASFLFPVTRRLTITLDIDDARDLASACGWTLPHCAVTLERLIADAEAES